MSKAKPVHLARYGSRKVTLVSPKTAAKAAAETERRIRIGGRKK